MEYQLKFPCCLPADPLGMGYGADYFTKVQAGRSSAFTTDYIYFSIKNGCEVHCLGMGEKSMALLLEISPYVLAYRCQYPMLLEHARARIDAYVTGLQDEMPEIRQRDVMSVDVLVTARSSVGRKSGVTLECPKYLVLSHKLREDLSKRNIKKRLATERNESKLAGYEYRVFSRNGTLDECGKSARKIYLWGKGHNVNEGISAAAALGEIFYRTYTGDMLDEYLIKVSKKLSISADECYQYLSAAINFGFLFVDLSFPVGTRNPIHLVKPSDAVPPWISFSGKVN
ncbi:hypothetical protein SAMN04487926_14039 [Paraburkholderia steynii]|uniref:TnsA endonuclease N-terminal domain-containing protein n=1 Tax=Paraburkholderia steynii TaxID=1245441 RepID=A0A7Z7BHR0_9BURK|nr:TnsA endonuclease N-terminal domain-containing protein [Paraburkholderia steynii]SDJ27087.1 hypothetical protein SAMN04487926_14039 [Paraburkholderia steynii]